MILMTANAACTVLQKTQQLVFDGNYKNTFMLAAMIFSVFIAAVYFIVSDKTGAVVIAKRYSYIPIVAGICNACVNLFIMILATRLDSGVVYPVIGVGSMIILLLASKLLFKERLTFLQWTGMGIGLISVILLSI